MGMKSIVAYGLITICGILNLGRGWVFDDEWEAVYGQTTWTHTVTAMTTPLPTYNPPFTLTTDDATDIASDSAVLHGTIVSEDPNYIVHCVGFEYGTVSASYPNSTCEGDGLMVSGKRSSEISGLSPLTTYYYRMYSVEKLGTAYGNEKSFTTLWATPTPVTTPAPECEVKSMKVLPKRLRLRRGEQGEVIVTLKGDTCVPEGETVTATIGRVDSKRVSVSSTEEITDEDGLAKFIISARDKMGNAKVTFEANNLRKSVVVKVR